MAKEIAVPVGANSDINPRREHAGDQSSEDNDNDHVSEEELISVGMIKLLDGFLQFAKAKCSRYPMNHSDKSTKCGPSIFKDIDQPDISAGSGYSKNSVEYFAGVIQSLTPHQRNVIKDHGFGSLLMFDHCSVPKRFAKWICRHVDVKASEIKLGDKLIPICKESVNIVTGLPIGGDEVTLNREAGMAYLLSKFQLSNIPPVTYFGDKLRCADLSEEMILSCFAIVALSSFLAPNSSFKPSPKYLSVLENIYDLLKFDWSKLVFDWLMKRIYKFNNKITYSGKSCKPLGGCIYFIAVYYLDFVNFGVHYVPRGIPRIKVWRGDMIKSYSKRDQINGRTFGKRPIKDLLNTCYAKIEPISQNFCSGHPNLYGYNISEFQAKLEASFGDCLPSEVKSSFCSLLEGINSRDCNSCHQKADSVILSVLQILSDAASNSSANSEQGTPSLTQDPSKKSLCDNFSASKDHNNLSSNGLVVDPGLGSVPSNIEAKNVSENIAPSNDKRQIECSNSRSCTPTIILESSDDNSQKQSSPQPMSKFNGVVNAKSGTEADIDELVIAAKNNTKLSHSQDKKIESHHQGIEIVTEKFIHSQPECISNVMERLRRPACVDTPLNMEGRGTCTDKSPCIPGAAHPIIKRRKLNKEVVNKNAATTSMIKPIHLFKINESDENPVDGCPIQYGNFVQPQENVLSQTSKKCHVSSLKQKSPEVKIVGEKKFSERNLELTKLSDNLYNNMISNDGAINMKKADPLARIQRMLRPKSSEVNPMFIPTANEIRYYDILCSLAYSQWSSQPGVKFGKSKRSTTVTYGSIGESVEPQGHVDNFFIAGYCRKFFEDRHPSTTKKHYCYPHYALLTCNGDSELKVVEHCFKGANSAHKLHLTNMMLFPIATGGHWFLFVVDFENKIFAFLDSIFGKSDAFQIDARNKLIPAFKEAWYKHAEVKISLEDFHYYYPTVPKQDNSDDCGIFVIAFMELWKYGLDLTKFFSQADISNLRIKFANNLFFSKTNLIDKSLVQNFFNEGIDPRICK
ncbi:hypothetical protein EJB05_29235, partial [Eragrostis curvula]